PAPTRGPTRQTTGSAATCGPGGGGGRPSGIASGMRRRRLRFLLAAAVVATAATLALSAQQPPDVTMALAGDSIITRPLAIYHEPEFMKLVETIRGADAAFTNLEMLFHDYESYPMHESGGTWMRADPALLKDLVWAGFD